MQCSDGLYCYVTEKEIVEIVTHAAAGRGLQTAR